MLPKYFRNEEQKMSEIDRRFDQIVPEQIIDCKFENMMFTNEMLEIYFMIDGNKSLEDIRRKLPMEMPDLINNIKKMTRNGIVRVRKKDKIDQQKDLDNKRKYVYRGTAYYE